MKINLKHYENLGASLLSLSEFSQVLFFCDFYFMATKMEIGFVNTSSANFIKVDSFIAANFSFRIRKTKIFIRVVIYSIVSVGSNINLKFNSKSIVTYVILNWDIKTSLQ